MTTPAPTTPQHIELAPVPGRVLPMPRTASRRWFERDHPGGWLGLVWYERVKRSIDILACVIALPLVVLLLMVCVVAIRLDSPGAAWFTQKRTGRGGRRFGMYKLRTMVRDAESLKQQVMHLNQLAYPDFKIADDPRVTRVGKFLRKSSLDEIPQIFNVLRGDMTLVGPRPTSFSSDTYCWWHTARLELKPGLTGLWQVSGRNELDFNDRVRLDIAYLRGRSLWLDVQILIRTVASVASARGAC